jgi:hypothetical protein
MAVQGASARPARTYPVGVNRWVVPGGVVFGLSVGADYAVQLAFPGLVALLVAGLLGALAFAAAAALSGPRVALVLCLLLPWPAALAIGGLLLVQPVAAALLLFALMAVMTFGLTQSRHGWVVVSVAGAVCVSLPALVGGSGAWSVDEPSATDPRMVAGNGVVVSVDTHAFLIAQAAVILENDGHQAEAGFLDSPDPRAPFARDARGRPTANRETYVWRLQLGARDADRSLKHTVMPDHFFNWWTHSGKRLVAGPSAATYAEQQFGRAIRAWRSGNRSLAMYHLGAATHLVDDACAPPHQFFLVPNHRAYEERMLRLQSGLAVDRDGIYQSEFRVGRGHGGPEWSSAHTRGWVDECAHRAVELVVNTAQPPPGDPASLGRLGGTFAHFRDTQRLTAGYLQFFFDTVGGP